MPAKPDHQGRSDKPVPETRTGRMDNLERLVEIIARADAPGGGSGETGARDKERHGAAMSVPGAVRHLDSVQLAAVTQTLRDWAARSPRRDVRASRLRVLLAYLLLRWTGAKLGEVLGLDDRQGLDLETRTVRLRKDGGSREVNLPEPAAREIAQVLADPVLKSLRGELLRLDPAHVRRKLYERAEELGMEREALNPTVLRRSRAIELLRADVPLPIVQATLGQSSPDLTASLVEFSAEDTRRIMARAMERETRRTSSARNAFFGKVAAVRRGDIQAEVEVATLGGLRIVCVVTTRSIDDLGLKPGAPVTAEVKAPHVFLAAHGDPYQASIENRLAGRVEEVRLGEISAEVVTALPDGTRMAAIITTKSARRLALAPGQAVRVLFSAFAVVLKVD